MARDAEAGSGVGPARFRFLARPAGTFTLPRTLGGAPGSRFAHVFAEVAAAAVRGVMHGGDMPEEPDLGDFDALEGVKQFPVRIKCALLPWTTLEEALQRAEEKSAT